MQGVRMRGVVEFTAAGGRILAEDGRVYAFDASAVQGGDALRLRSGCDVEFSLEDGARASGIRVLPTDKAARCLPRAGDASGAGTGRPLGMEPPPGVRGDAVAEASWESFPASDPPAW